MNISQGRERPAPSPVPLDPLALKAEIQAILQAQRLWVLATSAQDLVSARTMSIINQGLELWFQGSLSDLKGQQMQANPRVALCWNNVQYQGVAEIRGNALAGGNEWFCAEHQRVHPGSFARWASFPSEAVFVVHPQRIILWKYLDDQAVRDYLELGSSQASGGDRAWREAYC